MTARRASCLARPALFVCASWMAVAGWAEPDATFRDLRYMGTVAQTTEYSCGAAAVATLLSLYFGVESSEDVVLSLAEEQIRARGEEPATESGLTAYDLKEASGSLGLRLAGYELGMEELEGYFANGGFPVVAHVEDPRSHFIVVVGIAEEHLLLCDPGWGRYIAPIGELRDARGMSGVFLIALPTEEQAEHARRRQAEAVGWMVCRLSQLRDLRENLAP